MAFEQGHRKFGGRRKGTPNKSTAAARKLALATLGDLKTYAENARQRIMAGKAPRLETKLLEYIFGPPRPVEVRDPELELLMPLVHEDFDVGDAFDALDRQPAVPAPDGEPRAVPQREPVLRDDAAR